MLPGSLKVRIKQIFAGDKLLCYFRAEPGPEWSPAACDQFEALTFCAMWKVVWAKVMEYKASGVPCVALMDTTQAGEDRDIGQEMVRQGFASWVDKGGQI